MKFKQLTASMLAIGLLGAASAQAVTLRLSSWVPAAHPIPRDMVTPWTKQVEEATEGRVKVVILPKPLGNAPSHFDLAKDGIADLVYGVHGYQPGRFLLTKAVEMPFLGDSAESVSVAYWRIFNKHMAAANEHDGVVLLSLFTHGPGNIFNSKHAVNSLADLSGMKIRVGGGVVNDVAQAIGVIPMLKPAPTSYELMSNGVADGVFFPKESIKSFKLSKLVRHATFVPDGLYNTSFFLAMSPKAFNDLSKADQEAIMRVSGENFARLAGKAWDNVDNDGVATMKEDGVVISTAPPAMVAEIKAKTAPIEQAWVAEVKAKGIDGAALMADLRTEIAKVAAGN
jgi:TRAP-type C4-dicarboxylate transport system substrate-binding protein